MLPMTKPPSASRALADRMPGPVLLLDAAGVVIHGNPALAVALGATPEALAGRDLLGLVHPEEAAAAREWLQAAAQGRAETTLRVRHVDGSSCGFAKPRRRYGERLDRAAE